MPTESLCLRTNISLSQKNKRSIVKIQKSTQLIRWILSLVASFSTGDFVFGCFEGLFDNPLKTKVFALDYTEHPYFKLMIEKLGVFL